MFFLIKTLGKKIGEKFEKVKDTKMYKSVAKNSQNGVISLLKQNSAEKFVTYSKNSTIANL